MSSTTSSNPALRDTSPPTTKLQTSNPPTLIRQNHTYQSRSNKKRPTSIHRRARLQIRKHGDNGRHDAENAVAACREGVAGAAVFGGEDLGGVGVEDGVLNPPLGVRERYAGMIDRWEGKREFGPV